MKGLAVVTGASSGIGRAFARRLAAEDHSLLLVARRRERLEALATELKAESRGEIEILAADLTRDADLARVEERLKTEPRLEFLVNSAGFGTLELFIESAIQPQTAMHLLHVMATMRLSHAALPGMVARGKGSLVNVSSLAAFAQGPGNVSYCSTKAWMNSFTEGLYLELQSVASPVRVQALCPGFTLTEFHDVLGVDRSIASKFWWMKAEDVVTASMEGLRKGRLVVIPGWRYRLVARLFAVLPRRVLHSMARRRARRT
jgi:short-subunit dehydrogenase